ncbi:hypothetical protein MKX03_004081 [Papaver bracteatum]|nr:hypothetical protein MKX03_004081 [Papaver bracteatum]
MVQGTLGYLDPEYFHSSQLTEKSDVYSFGVVLVELLAGERPLSNERPHEQRNFSSYFIQKMEENDVFKVIDPHVVNIGKWEHIIAVAELARRCLNMKGRDRPTMKQVAAELENLSKLDSLNKDEWLQRIIRVGANKPLYYTSKILHLRRPRFI